MSVLVNDRELASKLKVERAKTDGAQHDEVWDGVYVMSPLPNIEHQLIGARLWQVLDTVVMVPGHGLVPRHDRSRVG